MENPAATDVGGGWNLKWRDERRTLLDIFVMEIMYIRISMDGYLVLGCVLTIHNWKRYVPLLCLLKVDIQQSLNPRHENFDMVQP